MTQKQQTLVSVLSAVIMVLLLLVSGRLWTRVDLSSNKINTLAPVSRNLRNEITEPVHITYYCTGKLFSIEPIPGEIHDLLREYAARSRGKIQVSLKDPSRGYIQDAERFGLASQTLPNLGEDELSIATVYSGIVIEYLNQVETISWVFALDTLEYDITGRIRSLIRGEKRELGIITPDPGKSFSDYYGIFSQMLSQSGISVLQIGPGEEIPDTLPALFVFGGVESLDDYALYRIDRYIQLGGKVLFAVDDVQEDYNYWNARLLEDAGLLAMLSLYGVTITPGIVLDQPSHIVAYRDQATGQRAQARYPLWIGVLPENGNADNPLTSGFAGADMYFASPLELQIPESVKGAALFSSTPEAWLMTRNFNTNPGTSYLFTAEEEATRGSKILAVSLEGVFPSRFKGADKPEADDRPPLPDMPSEAKESRIAVIGDADFVGYLIQFTQSQRNLDFMLRAADWLGNDADIAAIKNRRTNAGRLDRITDPDRKIGAMIFARILNVMIVPLVIVIFGITRVMKHRPAKTVKRADNPKKEGQDV